MTELESLIASMKAKAEANPCDPRKVGEALAEGRIPPFPDQLRGFIDLEGMLHQLQFTHDHLSDDKVMLHLSVARADQQQISDGVKQQLVQGFFGDEPTVEFPGNSMIGRGYVLHIGVIRFKT